jgi:nicotinamidase/pyrazinamidase
MSTPAFYHADRVGTLYTPDSAVAIAAGAATRTPPAAEDERRTILLLVDPQVDFIHTDGALSVPGAVDDTRRTIEWIFGNLDRITSIAASLDSHYPNHIFFPSWWVDADGAHPPPFTPISGAELDEGRWRPIFEPEWSIEYAHRLEEEAKKQLMIWPYHTLLGTPGHTITSALYEAIAYHASARESQPRFTVKGTIAKTEFYSLLEPEVPVPEDPAGRLNQAFLDEILGYDSVYIAGQAKSHCVLETITSIVRRFGDAPEVLRKLHILTDCTSSVVHPEIDFDAMANEAFARFANLGVRLVTSADPAE